MKKKKRKFLSEDIKKIQTSQDDDISKGYTLDLAILPKLINLM